MARQEWTSLKGHAGISYRQYETGERYFRFRQKPFSPDFLGVMDEAEAIKVAGELRHNRKTGTGPQSWKEREAQAVAEVQEQAVAKEAEAIKEKHERKRIIAAERFTQENTVGTFWKNVFWPHRKKTGSEHNNTSLEYMAEKWILSLLGEIPLEELTFTDVEKMLENMKESGLADKSAREMYIILQSMWTYAQVYLSVHNQITLPIFPGKILKLPKLNNKKTCWLEKEEASKLLDTLYNWFDITKEKGITPKGRDTKEAYGMAVLSLLSGMRLGDITKLRWRDVQTAFAFARTPKSGRAYGIHLDIPLVKEMLEERHSFFPNASPDDLVFVNWKGGAWKTTPTAYEDAVKHLKLNETPRRKDIPLEKIDFHALRHTFASWLAMAGTNLHVIMVLMDHKSIEMTLRYARLNPSYTRKPVQELAESFVRQHLSDGEYVYIETETVVTEMDNKIFMLEESSSS
jgi:Site-specific recombinase XerD